MVRLRLGLHLQLRSRLEPRNLLQLYSSSSSHSWTSPRHSTFPTTVEHLSSTDSSTRSIASAHIKQLLLHLLAIYILAINGHPADEAAVISTTSEPISSQHLPVRTCSATARL